MKKIARLTQEQNHLKNIIQKCKNLTTSFHHSSQLIQKLEEKQEEINESSNNGEAKKRVLRLIQEMVSFFVLMFTTNQRLSFLYRRGD